MGRHRGQVPEAPLSPYEGAGKRKLGVPPASPTPGRHAAERALARRRLVESAPGVLGVVAILGAMAGAALTEGSAAGPVDPAANKVPPADVTRSSNVEYHRSLAVSRSLDSGRGQVTSRVTRLAQQREGALAELNALADEYVREAERDRWVLPMSSYRLTGRFGEASSLWATVHTGLDFAAPSGTPIRAIASGVVTSAGWSGAYGNRTVVTLPDGTELWYCHQDRVDVGMGQTVARGQPIGTVGSTGNVTGPHLHLEVRPEGGGPVDPYAALAGHGTAP